MEIKFCNVVTVSSGWILQKIAERIVNAGNELGLTIKDKNTGAKCKLKWNLSHVPMTDYIANYYVDVQNCYMGPTNSIDIGYFTHLHENDAKHIQRHWLMLDHIVHKCSRYKNTFSYFYDSNKMSLIYPGEIHKGFDVKKSTIGIFQRGKYEGKGFHFMLDMAKEYYKVLSQFKWHFVGNDWEPVIEKFKEMDIEATTVGDNRLSYPDGYSKEYDKIDYLLIPSLWEGGPMSVIEAYAKGIPIIASDVGWCGGDFPMDYLFEPGNKRALAQHLNEIHRNELKGKLERRSLVSFLSYKYYANKLANIIGDIAKAEIS